MLRLLCFLCVLPRSPQGVVMDALRLGLPHGFGIPGLPARALLNSPMRLFIASGGHVLRYCWELRLLWGVRCASLAALDAAPDENASLLPSPLPHNPNTGCLTSLAGLALSFALTECPPQAAGPGPAKRNGSEAMGADDTVGGRWGGVSVPAASCEQLWRLHAGP